MDNVTNIISSHNKKINSGNESNGKTCSCRNKSNCPLDNKCLINKIVYQAEIDTNNNMNELSTKVYVSISETVQQPYNVIQKLMIPNFQNTFEV